ncbi:bifunctional phosphoribosyl-AMP cyclohydrolase/phosphoribosyl-ATP diphosphatase HisIE [Candidatus Borrarchaeum sp.]|uniref:bifunctional phosphoribosyl-AMP cyclohydrolase/phosphoribosyl-ATP diphosphatase HisIE n=1 Tax=Candidatus Borrarchaeum sp. TaxID=2846742 RepID=UPI00257A3F83|nr:bifunctional phosphoribosyl-AMP cyclohydrolase/phosphoribosyl-ATP diphosphatase HisIE [Candidatus Borrarchaeum sp.]
MPEFNNKTIEEILKEVDFEKGNGLIPAIAQDYKSKKVLMLAYMNETALRETLKTGYMTYWSRSRGILWKKGEQSGNRQIVKEMFVDCDNDALVFLVEPLGASCHKGFFSCFYRQIDTTGLKQIEEKIFDSDETYATSKVLDEVYEIIKGRISSPRQDSYVSGLATKGTNAIFGKVKEEFEEMMDAIKTDDLPHITHEITDLLFHVLVMLAHRGVNLKSIYQEFQRRKKH